MKTEKRTYVVLDPGASGPRIRTVNWSDVSVEKFLKTHGRTRGTTTGKRISRHYISLIPADAVVRFVDDPFPTFCVYGLCTDCLVVSGPDYGSLSAKDARLVRDSLIMELGRRQKGEHDDANPYI